MQWVPREMYEEGHGGDNEGGDYKWELEIYDENEGSFTSSVLGCSTNIKALGSMR